MESVTITILAGGESRRMGRDKAKLEIAGETLLERIAREAQRVAPTAVVGRTDADAFDLPYVSFVPDEEPDLGPIGGLRTALRTFEMPIVLIGCDMPRVDADALRWLLRAHDDSDASDGLVAETETGIQPLFGVYRPSLEQTASEMIDAGERSLRRLVRRSDIALRRAPDPVAERLVNVNTPEEFRELQN